MRAYSSLLRSIEPFARIPSLKRLWQRACLSQTLDFALTSPWPKLKPYFSQWIFVMVASGRKSLFASCFLLDYLKMVFLSVPARSSEVCFYLQQINCRHFSRFVFILLKKLGYIFITVKFFWALLRTSYGTTVSTHGVHLFCHRFAEIFCCPILANQLSFSSLSS